MYPRGRWCPWERAGRERGEDTTPRPEDHIGGKGSVVVVVVVPVIVSVVVTIVTVTVIAVIAVVPVAPVLKFDPRVVVASVLARGDAEDGDTRDRSGRQYTAAGGEQILAKVLELHSDSKRSGRIQPVHASFPNGGAGTQTFGMNFH